MLAFAMKRHDNCGMTVVLRAVFSEMSEFIPDP